MRWASLLAACALSAAACDDTESKDGARGSCASGGALAGCEDDERTAEAACWRLVECGSYPLERPEMDGGRDWGRCVDDIEAMPDEVAALVIACIVSSTCDELLVPGSPSQPFEDPACFDYGDI